MLVLRPDSTGMVSCLHLNIELPPTQPSQMQIDTRVLFWYLECHQQRRRLGDVIS